MKYKTLDMLSIPYKIEYTEKLVGLLMEIAECKPFFVNELSKPLKVTLLRSAKVKAITYSNQIEGNTLNEKEVALLVSKTKKIKNSDHEAMEIQNYAEALDYAQKLVLDKRKLKVSDFCDLQRLITNDLIDKKQLGRLRTINVSIGNPDTGKIYDTCPEPHYLKDAINDLWKWLEETSDVNPFIQAFAFHFIAVAIHPFADGNGRTCRLMQQLLLLKSGEDLAMYVPSETAIMNYREDYYMAIRQSKKLGKLNPILEFLAMCFAQSAKDITKEAKKLLKKESLSPDQRRDKILGLAKKKGEFKILDIVKLLADTPRRTLERDLENLCKNNLIISIGENKARTYKIRN